MLGKAALQKEHVEKDSHRIIQHTEGLISERECFGIGFKFSASSIAF
jgi:hypothetical protein